MSIEDDFIKRSEDFNQWVNSLTGKEKEEWDKAKTEFEEAVKDRERRIEMLIQDLEYKPFTEIQLDGYHLFEVTEAINKLSQKNRASRQRDKNSDAITEFTNHFKKISQRSGKSASFRDVIRSLRKDAEEGKSSVFSRLTDVQEGNKGEAFLLDEESRSIPYSTMKRWLTPLRKEFNADIQKKSH